MRLIKNVTDFPTELAKCGYTLDHNSFVWCHKNGAMLSVECVQDLERIWGRVMVARALDFLELHNHQRGFSFAVDQYDDRGMVGYTVRVRMYPQSVLELIALASVDD